MRWFDSQKRRWRPLILPQLILKISLWIVKTKTQCLIDNSQSAIKILRICYSQPRNEKGQDLTISTWVIWSITSPARPIERFWLGQVAKQRLGPLAEGLSGVCCHPNWVMLITIDFESRVPQMPQRWIWWEETWWSNGIESSQNMLKRSLIGIDLELDSC